MLKKNILNNFLKINAKKNVFSDHIIRSLILFLLQCDTRRL